MSASIYVSVIWFFLIVKLLHIVGIVRKKALSVVLWQEYRDLDQDQSENGNTDIWFVINLTKPKKA